jgi:hypothetical protein
MSLSSEKFGEKIGALQGIKRALVCYSWNLKSEILDAAEGRAAYSVARRTSTRRSLNSEW